MHCEFQRKGEQCFSTSLYPMENVKSLWGVVVGYGGEGARWTRGTEQRSKGNQSWTPGGNRAGGGGAGGYEGVGDTGVKPRSCD